MEIRIFVFDIDGTTFDHSIYDVRKLTMEALRTLKEKGYLLSLSTSRSIAEMHELKEDFLSLMDAIICLGGAIVDIDGQRKVVTFKKDQIEKAISYMDDNGITYRYATGDGMSYINRHEEWVEEIFRRLYHMCPILKDYEGEPIAHINYYCNEDQEYHRQKIEELLPEAIHTHLRITTELTPSGVDKGIVLEQLADHYGYTVENICAFGDGYNDITMLRKAGLSIAMGNASTDVKEAADDVTDPISEDGLYKALKKYMFI